MPPARPRRTSRKNRPCGRTAARGDIGVSPRNTGALRASHCPKVQPAWLEMWSETRERGRFREYTISIDVLILALDTTTRAGSVAVTDDDRVLTLLAGDESRTHGERLPAEIATALDRASVTREQLDLLAVAAGPGGFTGLRIGLAVMQGLAMTLNKPVAGVSTLDALAAQVADGAGSVIVPWMDAHRGDVFASLVDGASREIVEPPVAEQPALVLARWR